MFTKGLAADDEPALWQRDLTDRLLAWIEVGSPSTDRLHRASKLGARVVVYAYKGATELAKQVVEAKVHRASELEIRALDGAFLDRVAATLDRNNKWELSVSGGGLYLTIGGKLHETTCERIFAPEAK